MQTCSHTLRRYFIFSILVFAPMMSVAKIEVVQNSVGGLVMSAPSCDILTPQVRALQSWSTKLGEQPALTSGCLCDSASCRIEITKIVPEFVLHIYGVTAEYGGPNCWNAVLVSEKILSGLRYSSPDEMAFWMASPLCKELETGEPLQPGDVMAIRHRGEGDVHGFVYLTEELAFSKNAYYRNAPYLLQDPDYIFNLYGAPLGCRQKEAAFNRYCQNYVTYFRCQPLNDYLASRRQPISRFYSEMERTLSQVEHEVADIIFNGRSNPDLKNDVKKNLVTAKSFLQVLRPLAVQQYNVPGWSEDELLLRQALILRIDALLEQIEYP